MFRGERSKKFIEATATVAVPAIAAFAIAGCSVETKTDTTQPKAKVERAQIEDAIDGGLLNDTEGRNLIEVYDDVQVINTSINGKNASRDCVIRGVSKLNNPDDFGQDSLGFPYVKATSIKIPTKC